jgi:hypothetical protein
MNVPFKRGGYIRATKDVLGEVGKKASTVYKKVGGAKGKNVPQCYVKPLGI